MDHGGKQTVIARRIGSGTGSLSDRHNFKLYNERNGEHSRTVKSPEIFGL